MRGGKRRKCAGEAALQGRFLVGGCGCGEFHALREMLRSMAIPSALPSIFSAAGFSRAGFSVASVRIEEEDENRAVFVGDLDQLF